MFFFIFLLSVMNLNVQLHGIITQQIFTKIFNVKNTYAWCCTFPHKLEMIVVYNQPSRTLHIKNFLSIKDGKQIWCGMS